jgi:hypothetical protein
MGYSYDCAGRYFLPPGHKIASDDHKRFIANRTSELWAQSMEEQGLTFDADPEKLQDLFDEAMDQAARELVDLARTKKRYRPRKPGRRAGSGAVTYNWPTDGELCRLYEVTRSSIRASGTQYSAVARRLWVRYSEFQDTFPSLHALRVRMMRALRKLNTK